MLITLIQVKLDRKYTLRQGDSEQGDCISHLKYVSVDVLYRLDRVDQDPLYRQ